ncbi:zinc finger protein 888-like [Culicoides brevitarsis]|uniref:zinc finger protein 888-like n=1 Tax=Culicoides brevitarsis TaxID=469753 RepID=UPI00307B30D4
MFICRVCLTLEDNLYPIIPSYSTQFTECTGIADLKNTDFLCPSCIRKLNDAQTFRSEALKSDEILKNNLQDLINAEIKKEPEEEFIEERLLDENLLPEMTNLEVLDDEVLDEELAMPFEGPSGVLEVTLKRKIVPPYENVSIIEAVDVNVAKSLRSIKAKMAWTEETKKFLIKNCPYCFYYNKNKVVMKDHIQEHLTKNGGVECDHCGKKWPSKLRLYEHLNKIYKGGYKRNKSLSNGARRRMFACDFCDQQFDEKMLLEKHMQQIHPNVEHNFLCNTCGKTFASQKRLKNHTISHKNTGNNKFECQYCGKRFKLKASQQYHLLSHTNELNFTCSTCGRGFKTKQALRDHEPIHTGELPYQCDGCEKRFRSRGLLRSHRLIHSEGKYQCEICSLRFRRTSNLNDHMLCHTERRDYSCSICGTMFKAVASLKRHMKKHHEKEKKMEEKEILEEMSVSGEILMETGVI